MKPLLIQGKGRSGRQMMKYEGHILNAMSNSLFDIYHSVPTAKELWDRLEMKYMQEDATSKKFLVSKFNNFNMVDVDLLWNNLLR